MFNNKKGKPVKNPAIKTPENMNQIMDLIEKIPVENSSRALAMTAVLMVWNLSCDQHQPYLVNGSVEGGAE